MRNETPPRDRSPRQGWEKVFQVLDAVTEDQLLLDTVAPNEFDREEWEW
jgi:hypothetical protein